MRFTAQVDSLGRVYIDATVRKYYDINRTDFVELEVIKVRKK